MDRLRAKAYVAAKSPEEMEAYRAKRRERQRLAYAGLRERSVASAEERLERRRAYQRRRYQEARASRVAAGLVVRPAVPLAERQKKCEICGEWFDARARVDTWRWKARKTCGSDNCRTEMDLRKMRAAQAMILKRSANAEYAAEVAARSTIIGHENGVPVRRVERGVGYGD